MTPARAGFDRGPATALLALLVALAVAGPAYGGARDVAGRGFTIARPPATGPLAVGPTGTAWMLDGPDDGALWRRRPTDRRPSRVATPRRYSGLSAQADGGLLLVDAEEPVVWRRAPDGHMTAVAGRLDPPDAGPPAVEGGPAAGASLCSVGSVAAAPDGGFVFADRYGKSVRRVGAEGRITTLYAVTPADRQFSCPPDATFGGDRVDDLAVQRDGAVLVLVARDSGADRIVRVSGTGAQTVLAAHVEAGAIATGPDGAVLVMNGDGVGRIAPGARRPTTILPGDDSDEEQPPLFDRDGSLAGDWFGEIAGFDVAPDGGIVSLMVSDIGRPDFGPPRLVYVAPAAPRLAAAALAPVTGRATAQGYDVRYRATRPGVARLTILDARGRVVARARRRAPAGTRSIGVARRLPFGTYDVRLTVSTADGQRASDEVRLLLGGTLPVDFARRLLVPRTVNVGGDCDTCDVDERRVRPEGCQRAGARAVDCRYSYVLNGRVFVDASARLLLDGTLEYVRDEDSDFSAGMLPEQPSGGPTAAAAGMRDGVPAAAPLT